MSTNTWVLVWQVVLVGGLGLFAVMSVWIAFAGWQDVKNLFAAMGAVPVSGRKARPAGRRRTRR